MPFASSAQARIAYVAEATYGATPATPAFKTLRVTGGGLRPNKSTGTSAELNPDRNIRDEFMLGIDVAGDYAYELSYGTLDDLLEGALFNTWATNVLKNGVTTRSFTLEETMELGATDAFSRFTGAMVNTLGMSITARAAVTGSIGMMARDEGLATAIVTGATYAASNTKNISTASAHVAGLAVAGLSPVPKIRAVNFEINNNLRTRPVVGNKFSEELGYGLCDVTGNLEAYFESNALYQMVLDHGGGALSLTVGGTTLEKYTILFPKIIFLNGEKRLGGNNDDVMVNIPWRAVYDTTALCSVQITRAVA